ncbi:hypothetical protein LR48_Vigan01g104200 [Vigna angularis]|uniref:Uncharacterized protein n=1 Tax=Phaseolus angularis TaxID=3914 RepID=A0A0L9TM28_PHAAN|nr:hypothetical protein LR48_Vigan01g104200 [Vigna angularis]
MAMLLNTGISSATETYIGKAKSHHLRTSKHASSSRSPPYAKPIATTTARTHLHHAKPSCHHGNIETAPLQASSSQKLHPRPTNKNHQTRNQAQNRETQIQRLTATTLPPRPRRAMRKEFPPDLAKLRQAQRDTLEQQRDTLEQQRDTLEGAARHFGAAAREPEAPTREESEQQGWRQSNGGLHEEEEDFLGARGRRALAGGRRRLNSRLKFLTRSGV